MQRELNIGLVQISAEEYHSNEALGHSRLLRILRSPAHYLDYVSKPYEPTPAMVFGTAIHAAILEPETFVANYAVFDESLLVGTLQSLDDYKVAAKELGVRCDAMNKDELKAAIKAADSKSEFTFKDDIQTEMATLTQDALVGTLSSLDEFKQAAESLGITSKLKKDELKAAIKAADVESKFKFKDDVLAEMATLTQEKMAGTLQSLDDYKLAATSLGVRFDAPNKDELKVAIKAADGESRYVFRDDKIASLYESKIMLKPEEMQAIESIKANIASHFGASVRLASGAAELSGFWTDRETGVSCKLRPDWVVYDESGRITAMVDVKSTDDASKAGFSRSIAKYGYDVQAAYYVDGLKEIIGYEVPFLFLPVEKTGPHSVALYKASEKTLEAGRKKVRAGLLTMRYCLNNNTWPAYQTGNEGDVEEIDLPTWAERASAEFDID